VRHLMKHTVPREESRLPGGGCGPRAPLAARAPLWANLGAAMLYPPLGAILPSLGHVEAGSWNVTSLVAFAFSAPASPRRALFDPAHGVPTKEAFTGAVHLFVSLARGTGRSSRRFITPGRGVLGVLAAERGQRPCPYLHRLFVACRSLLPDPTPFGFDLGAFPLEESALWGWWWRRRRVEEEGGGEE